MRVEWLHLGWFLTHILRSVVDTDQTKHLISALASEVQSLQLELHRAHRLLEKYADTVEAAERASALHSWTTTLFTCIFAILGLLLGYSWLCRRPRLIAQTRELVSDTDRSSDSESLVPGKSILDVGKAPTVGGPARPSTLGRGKGR